MGRESRVWNWNLHSPYVPSKLWLLPGGLFFLLFFNRNSPEKTQKHNVRCVRFGAERPCYPNNLSFNMSTKRRNSCLKSCTELQMDVPSHAKNCFSGLYWLSGSAGDTSPDPWPSVPLQSRTSWGQSGGLAGNETTVIRDKDTSLLPKPRVSGRRVCRDGRSNRSGQ